ncbi:BglG family transcription antiterminator [Halalkalibacter lacteus]|uniref:BglG family transcription antiterminator n=1 Tax=Halalkalibacter lacteus TaxID=3090663 RepID=UPI002FC98064
MANELYINSRQEKLVRFLLEKTQPITVKELANELKVSTRTVQREFKSINLILIDFDLKLMKKLGVGVKIEGSEEGRKKLFELLAVFETDVIYSPEERQQGLISELLLNREPAKLFSFSNKYKVTEATISHDLDHIEDWLRSYHVKLIRKPGLGVFVSGSEKQIRMAAAQIFYLGITLEKWLEIIYSSNDSNNKWMSLTQNNPLLSSVHIPDIIYVEKILREVIATQHEIEPSDRDYINLLIHLSLTLDRIRHGEFVAEDESVSNSINVDYYPLASKIAKKIESYINSKIPEVEVAYIAMHLYGIRLISGDNVDVDSLYWLDITRSFVKVIEEQLSVNLSSDQSLLDGLVTHLIPAITRLELGLQIHNPMLEYIEEHFSNVFLACVEGCKQITMKTGYEIPDAEVGYLATHIGATLLRIEENAVQQYNVVVVCASGFGTSRFLASKLKLEFSNLNIVDIVSVSKLTEWLEENNKHNTIHLVISTVPLQRLLSVKLLLVNPFLLERDLQVIKKAITELSLEQQNKNQPVREKPDIKVFATYGEAMLQILRNFTLIEETEQDSKFIPLIVQRIADHNVVRSSDCLQKDLEKREELGGFHLGNVMMLHAKTAGVSELLCAVFRLKHPIQSVNSNDTTSKIDVVLLLAVPTEAPKEHVEMISEISATLVDDSFLTTLAFLTKEEVKSSLEEILSKLLHEKLEEQRK